MTEVDWGTEANEAPKPKSRIPKWAWFCGGGCLLAIIAAGVVGFLIFRQAQEMMDEDKQTAELQAVLPFETLPEGYRILGVGAFAGFMPGVDDAWMIHVDGGGTQVQISRYTPSASAEMRESISSGDLGSEAKSQFGPFGLYGLTHGEVEVQGRKLPWMRFQTFESEDDSSSGEGEETGDESKPSSSRLKDAVATRMLLLDLTAEGEQSALILQFQRAKKGPAIEPSEVVEFLAPFKLGAK